MKKNTLVNAFVSILLIISTLFLCSFDTAMNSQDKTTEELLEEILAHPDLQAPSLYSSFELYLNTFDNKCPEINILLTREDLFVTASYECEEIMSSYDDLTQMSSNDFTKYDFLDSLIEYLSNSSSRGETTNTLYVYTCKGNPVLAYQYEELSDFEIATFNHSQQTQYPNVLKLDEPTSLYNCHSYAWYSQSTLNPYWIPYPESFLTDGTYAQSIWQVGDRIVYYNSDGTAAHSGIITARSGNSLSQITVTSKWGAWGLYEHAGNYCPYDTSNVVVYRLCVHSESTYTKVKTNVNYHSVTCPTCGHLKLEVHTFNNQGRCTGCGAIGSNIEINSVFNNCSH